MLLNRIFNEMNELFEPMRFPLTPAFVAFPPVNVREDAGQVYVEAELPGMKLADIQVALSAGNQLTIAGERKFYSGEETWYRQECGHGRFSRTLTLPFDVDAEKCEAKYEAGILTLTLPKTEAAKPKRITVKSGQESPSLVG